LPEDTIYTALLLIYTGEHNLLNTLILKNLHLRPSTPLSSSSPYFFTPPFPSTLFKERMLAGKNTPK
jgi:hypothetical protein